MKSRNFIFILGVFFLLHSTLPAFAQRTLSKSFDIRTEGIRPKFTKLFRDSKGLIWTGTDKGIFSFDGINFSKITGSDSLSIGHVSAIFEDKSGIIWAGYENGKLPKLQGETFQPIHHRKGFRNRVSVHL